MSLARLVPPYGFDAFARRHAWGRDAPHKRWRRTARMATANCLLNQLRDSIDDWFRRGVGFIDQRRELFAILRIQRKPALVGFRDELRVLHGGVERFAQHLQSIRRHARRRDEGPADTLADVK